MKRGLVISLIAFILLSYAQPTVAFINPVRARSGMVASSDEIASKVGVEILKQGGNAVDAAVAVGLALAVTLPQAGNIGGGGFMVIHLADGRNTTIDYREVAPAKAKHNMYLDSQGNPIPEASTIGYLSAGVPGTIAGLALALQKYGTMKWADVIEPARKLATDGFAISPWLADTLRGNSKLLERFPASRRIFLNDGKYYNGGELFKQPELAKTLERLKKEGSREFYEGRTAQLIAEEMKANGGMITLQDLKDYKPLERLPLRGTYRGYEILTMPPPSSGGVALLEMLNILEHYDIAAMGDQSSEKYHLLIETMRRAFADRAEFMGDPDFVKVPVAGLISKSYALELKKSIDPSKATPSDKIGHGTPPANESKETTHYTIVDAKGNAVSNTYTLNGWFGSGATVSGAGFLLNNEMDDFAVKPGAANAYGLVQGQNNAIAAGKRPLSSMTPTIVLKEGKLYLAVGSPGGPTIINQMLQVIVNTIDHGMNIQEAINAPRLHHQWFPDYTVYEPFAVSKDVLTALKAKGHAFSGRAFYLGDVQAVMVDLKTGERLGGSDPRGQDGRACGY
jgi:gamma-glutamyltranspeptidase / glutathione hydrolase